MGRIREDVGRGSATMEVEATLAALYAGAVQTLAIERNLVLRGYVCQVCHRLFVQDGICPECGQDTPEPVGDLVEAAVEATLRPGCCH